MPIDYTRYPSNWKTEIRPAILQRDKYKCKFCGAINGSIVKIYSPTHRRVIAPVECNQINQLVHGGYYRSQAIKKLGFVKIVLTIAHLDQDITNNANENLAALCQRCHLNHDRKANAENCRQKALTGQLTLTI